MNKSLKPDAVTTLEITNFTGKLTRKLNGGLDSGMAKFDTSWGYDPFSKPGNLTWYEAPVDLDPTASVIQDMIVCAKPRIEGGNQLFIYAVGNTGRVYKIQPNSVGNPNLDSATLLTTLSISGNSSFLFGGSMEFYGATEKIYIGNDTRVCSVNFDGTGEVSVSGSFTANVYRPLMQFVGKLYYGNGMNIGEIDTTGTVTTQTKLSPSLPQEVNVRDLDVSPDGNYLVITASAIPSERQDYGYDRVSSSTGTGYKFKWNGTDAGITSYNIYPSHAITAYQSFNTNEFIFSNDSFGLSLDSGSGKIRTLQNNRSAIPNAIASNGNFITWMSTEFCDATLKGSMYYYGKLDEESDLGMWRMFRLTSTQTNGFIYTVPLNILVTNKFSTVNNVETAVATYAYGKHYFSTFDLSNGGGTSKYKLYRFLVTSSGSGTPNLGVYETQTQLFGKRVSINEVRVYCEGTVASNGFQLDVITSNGSVVSNGTFNYTYAAGTDITLLQGSLERINFNPNIANLYAIGIRITNTGTTNMTIKKIEIDVQPAGK